LNLALSAQCGFASTAVGNQLTVDDERRKLELVVGTASKDLGLTGLARPPSDGGAR